LGLGTQRNSGFVGFRKRLQAADVNGEGELSVSHRQRAEGVGFR